MPPENCFDKLVTVYYGETRHVSKKEGGVQTRVSREALLRIGVEWQSQQFTSSIINRLKNEDPQYAYLSLLFAKQAKEKLGEDAFKLALDYFTIAYRVIELSERYTDKKTAVGSSQEKDILESTTPQEFARARAEMKEWFERYKKPFGKGE